MDGQLGDWMDGQLGDWIPGFYFLFFMDSLKIGSVFIFILIHGQLGEFGYLSLMTIRAIPNAEVHRHSSQEDLKKDLFEDKYPCNILLKYIIFFLP